MKFNLVPVIRKSKFSVKKLPCLVQCIENSETNGMFRPYLGVICFGFDA